ncbi:MFS transporter [Actinomadura kijaniata]|uniref:MFS transporter n=1 Tax=Actinomadura kijaniata TaxID=46161 RepID=UPI003F1B8A5A
MTAADAAPASARVLWTTVALAFSAVLLDGFDSAALAFSVPVLAGEWGLSRAAFTAPLVLTNLGVVVGYLACGPLSSRLGRRRVLIGGVVFFAAATLLTAATLPVRSVPLLGVTRVLTGLGLGAVLPAAVALATDHAPVRRRQLVSVAVTLGLASGATLGGLFGGRMLQGLGAAGVFWIAGGLPLALAAVMAWRLPAGVGAGTAGTARPAERVSGLLPPGMRLNTALIWAFSFLAFLSAYTLQSWVPSLMGDFGFADSEAPLGLAFFSIGGIAGGVLLVWLASRVPIALALCALSLTGAACAFAVARADLGGTVLLVVLGGTGLGLVGSQIGQLAMAVALYPAATRTTGVGWAAAFGRAGSIVGPAVAGVLLGLSLPGRDIVLLTTVPVLTAALCALVLWRRQAGGGAVPAAQRRA